MGGNQMPELTKKRFDRIQRSRKYFAPLVEVAKGLIGAGVPLADIPQRVERFGERNFRASKEDARAAVELAISAKTPKVQEPLESPINKTPPAGHPTPRHVAVLSNAIHTIS